MTLLARILSLCLGYAFGNISPGLIMARLKGVNLRNVGSGNVGSTNVSRALGFKFGLICLFFDCAKSLVPASIAYVLAPFFGVENPMVLSAYAAFAAIMGHCFPIALKFKGGKGIATSLGFLIVLHPYVAIGCLTVFLIAVIITRYVSLGSVLCCFVAPALLVVLGIRGILPYEGGALVEVAVIACVDAFVCLIKHRENLARLMSGTENKFTIKKK